MEKIRLNTYWIVGIQGLIILFFFGIAAFIVGLRSLWATFKN